MLAEIEDSVEESKVLRLQANLLKEELKNAIAEAERWRTEVETLNKRLSNVHALPEVVELQQQLQRTKQECDRQRTLAALVQSEKQQLEKRLAAALAQAAAQPSTPPSTPAASTSEGSSAVAEHRELEKLRIELTTLRSEKDALEKRLTLMQGIKKTLESNLEQALQQSYDNSSQLQILREDRAELQRQLDDRNQLIKQLKEDNRLCREREAELERRIQQLTIELEQQTFQTMEALLQQRATQAAKVDKQFRKKFPSLAATEQPIDSFVCAYASHAGTLYITPSYVCFLTFRLLGSDQLAIEIRDIMYINKIRTSSRIPTKGYAMEVKLHSDSSRVHIFTRMINRKRAIKTILQQAERLGVNIVTLRDGKKDQQTGLLRMDDFEMMSNNKRDDDEDEEEHEEESIHGESEFASGSTEASGHLTK